MGTPNLEQLRGEFREFLENPPKVSYKQKQMFLEIWEEREPFSQLSGDPLIMAGKYKWHWQFLHVLPKGTYPLMKFFKPNILLGLPDEHEAQESYEVFQEWKAVLNQVYHEIIYNKKYE